jgi:hypothetical protein
MVFLKSSTHFKTEGPFCGIVNGESDSIMVRANLEQEDISLFILVLTSQLYLISSITVDHSPLPSS